MNFKQDDIKVKSLREIKNNSGPRIDPCGTPQVILEVIEVTPLTRTNWVLLFRYSVNHDLTTPLIPKLSNLLSRISWFTVSKAFEISKKTPMENILLFIASLMLDCKSNSAI